MARIPDMNLDPAATPWGRWVQDGMAELDRSAERRANAEVNTNKGLNATLAALSGQIATIAAQQTALDQTVADLDAQQTLLDQTVTDLASAQTTLAGQQTTLNQTVTGLAAAQTTLAGQQTTLDQTVADLADAQTDLAGQQTALAAAVTQLNSNADAGANVQSFSGSSVFGTNKVVATVTFTKPTWATRCVVMAISVVTTSTTNQSTAPLSGTARTVVAGTASAAIDIGTQASLVYTTKAIPLNRSFGTSSNVTVQTQATVSGGSASNALSASLAATVFWYA